MVNETLGLCGDSMRCALLEDVHAESHDGCKAILSPKVTRLCTYNYRDYLSTQIHVYAVQRQESSMVNEDFSRLSLLHGHAGHYS